MEIHSMKPSIDDTNVEFKRLSGHISGFHCNDSRIGQIQSYRGPLIGDMDLKPDKMMDAKGRFYVFIY